MQTHPLLTFFLSLRAIMLIGSAGALVGSLLMFLQGGFFLHEAWHTIMTEGDAVQKQVTVPVLEAVDSFLFGIVLVIFARIVVEANGHLQWSMLVLPASILMISVALRMIELGSKEEAKEDDAAISAHRGTE